jgi:hypothetical protein
MWCLFDLIEAAFKLIGKDATITCGTNGHAGTDPHYHGYALDFRCNDLTEEEEKVVIGYIEEHVDRAFYYVFHENDGQPEEHIHIQVRKAIWPGLQKKG